MYLVFHLLRTQSDVGELLLFAAGTLFGHTSGVAAVMAGEQLTTFVVGQTDIAMRTAGHPSALFAFHE